MFVKFGDKTKPLNVKSGKSSDNSEPDSNSVYIEDEDERRAEALKKSLAKDETGDESEEE